MRQVRARLDLVAVHLHTLTITLSEALVTRVRSALQPLENGRGYIQVPPLFHALNRLLYPVQILGV